MDTGSSSLTRGLKWLVILALPAFCLGSATRAQFHYPRHVHGHTLAPNPIPSAAPTPESSSDQYLRKLDELNALWSFYKHSHVTEDGRVVSEDEGGITTSEGQSYAMLRAVWSKDRNGFDRVWGWTKHHLQVREDHLLAWKWRTGRVQDENAASDADSDTALALILASREFSEVSYLGDALSLLNDIWKVETVKAAGSHYLTAGNWATHEKFPILHPAYFAPYAYEVFAKVDPHHPWMELIGSSYRVWRWIYFDQALRLPPALVFLDPRTGALSRSELPSDAGGTFGYDSVPLFWRAAQDQEWYGRGQRDLRQRMLSFFKEEWRRREAIFDRYTVQGDSLSHNEGLPLYATVYSLARGLDPDFADQLWQHKLANLWSRALSDTATPYYLQNWIWFSRAQELKVPMTYDEFLGFLRPFDFNGFLMHFPAMLAALMLGFFFLAKYSRLAKVGFMGCAGYLCARYLQWRLWHSLNFLETSGPVISITLWLAEFYCFSTVLLLGLQVGIRGRPSRAAPESQGRTLPEGFAPTVDVFIPIYSEPIDILEKTLIAARAIRYARKRVCVLDDSHRPEVSDLAARFGTTYIRGPRKHAKAGNINHALTVTDGDLIVIFDTDHIPVASFLEETVPPFTDPKLGFVQTPHHFYNEDIFQRSFQCGEHVPNEQDMFNHAIQGGRASWGGAFFVGSGAVFRREAIRQVGGFKLLSITEDIHTSQHLHALGWKSAFVDKDLAVGLAAESLSSFIVQRRRWMLGCLQILLKDNPLFCRGLGLRHRLGYFASLYYFLFPIPRLIFWVTPLYYLLFHWHPILSDVSVLMAYLVPYMIALPLISASLLPGWPRILWGSVYEMAVCFPLFRSMFDLFLPKTLGFKVTPKGIVSAKRSFDVRSAQLTLVAVAITVIAIAKGLLEFYYFEIEKDAYFFNLAWASVNLIFLLMALLVAWERPQRRADERVRKSIPFRFESGELRIEGKTHDVSLSGISFFPRRDAVLSAEGMLQFLTPGGTQSLPVRLVYNDSPGKCAFTWMDAPAEIKEFLVCELFGSAETWSDFHRGRARSGLAMMGWFIVGCFGCFLPYRPRNRRHPRRKVLKRIPRGVIRDISDTGFGVLRFGRREPGHVLEFTSQEQGLRRVYVKKVLPFTWREGFEFIKTGTRGTTYE